MNRCVELARAPELSVTVSLALMVGDADARNERTD
jgi:hypothetical protein